jgi:hypothetical protein
VASEKNVEACVVSMFRENVYDDWKLKPFFQRRRTSTSKALYHELPSLFSLYGAKPIGPGGRREE